MQKIKTSYLLIIFVALVAVILITDNVFLNQFKGQNPIKSSQISQSELVIQIQNSCANNNLGKETCYSKEFEKLSEKSGPDFAFEVLSVLQKQDPDAKGCHLIAHGIGEGAYKNNPQNWQNLIQNVNPSCNYGSIHGIMQQYVSSLPDKTLTQELIPSLCGDSPRADCNHIVGHLLLVETNVNTDKALALCDVFTDLRQKDFCQTGVFMEYQTALNLISHSLVPQSWQNWPTRLEELKQLCRSYSGQKGVNCWTEIVHVALVKFNNDPKQLFSLCDSSSITEATKRCKRHALGIIGASKNFNLSELKFVCELPQKNDPNFADECYPNMVASALSTIPQSLEEAVDFCGSLENKFQRSCFTMIGSIASHGGQLKTENVKIACQKIQTNEYKNLCLGSLQTNEQNYINQMNIN